ncbi:helix-turn-helix protein [Archangium gephyra]|uniref:Helix-turn-helix protein n=1 Tax=Archangium gephyra TaxID=48 RepID=A0ABX9K136_9BACT|nr:helix-turn-helix transcriptional regulator [Archangium gephyra]REG31118.1 helix-turn-helix protein [Archangium gephyra]
MRNLKDLTAFVEKEAASEGPAAQAALQAERARFRIARELAEARKAQGLTQHQLSERSGVPQSEISKIESGRANATELTLFKVVYAMGYSVRLEPLARNTPQRTVRPASSTGKRTVVK